ncbi:MAG: hypothetical protein KIT09_11890 [Bryobacteraceae bacterium]|nr:hypothetical protein [Bryobacteraceae bacterium]
MSQTGRLIQIDDRCEYLRWKGLYVDGEQNYYASQSGDRLFWCVKTQNCLGPDGRIADDYECSAGRACFRPL